MGHDHPSLDPRYDGVPSGGFCLLYTFLLPFTVPFALGKHFVRFVGRIFKETDAV